MRFATSLTLLTVLGVAAGTARGQALDEEGKPKPTTDPAVAPTNVETKGPGLEYGVDLRLRQVFIPKGLLGLFVESVPGGSSNTGLGVDLVRRRGDLELQLGFEYEHIEPHEGVWINSGDTVPTDTVDYILNPDHAGTSFGWFTVEFTFLNHAPINKYVAIRYGGGAGIGFLTGEVKRVDTQCTGAASNSNPVPGCVPIGYTYNGQAGQGAIVQDNPGDQEPHAYDFPPVFPVVNAIIGVQIRPTPKAVVNIEGGIRTIPFIGLSAGYFFN
jgi:hypothetical protein